MSTVAGLRLVSSITGGSLTAENLTATITPPQGIAGWKAVLLSPVQRSLLANDKTARGVWMQSSKAADEFMLNGAAVRELLRNPDAVADLLGNSTALDAFWKSRAARFELWTNDFALDKFDQSNLAIARAEACADLKKVPANLMVNFNSGRAICVGAKMGFSSGSVSFSGRRAISNAGRIVGDVEAGGRVKILYAADGGIKATKESQYGSYELWYFGVDQ